MRKRIWLILALVLATSMVALACEGKLTLTAPSTAKPGDTVQLKTNAKDAAFELTDGQDHADLSDKGLITVADDAPVGTVISAIAKKGKKTSNTVSIEIIHIKVTAINNAAATLPLLRKGEETQLTCDITPLNATEAVSYHITNDYDATKVSINGSTLTLKNDAPDGDITLVAKAGDVTSAPFTVSVVQVVPLISITISPSAAQISKGGRIPFKATLNPINTTDTIEWRIVSGGTLGTLDQNGNLQIRDDLTDDELGQSITVKAVGGGKESNTSVITIRLVSYSLSIATTLTEPINRLLEITNTTEGAAAPLALFGVTNSKGEPIYNLTDIGMFIEFEVSDGSNNIQLEGTNAFSRTIKQLRHGTAKIMASLKDADGNIHDEEFINIRSIKTPSIIRIPDFLSDARGVSNTFVYSLGKYIESKNEIDFTATVPNINSAGNPNFGACDKINYVFELLDGADAVTASGDEIGTFNNGKIRFLTPGKVRLRIRSDSGNASNKEREVSQIFEVNEYQNVDNWEDFKTVLTSGDEAVRGVNIVVTKKTLDKAGKDYGYSIVPNFVLNGGVTTANTNALKAIYGGDEPAEAYYMTHINISIVDKSVVIRGNNHAVNFSGMDVINIVSRKIAIDIYSSNDLGGDLGYLASVTGLRGATSLDSLQPIATIAPIYSVDIANLRMLGNARPDGKCLLNGKDFFYDETTRKHYKNGTHDRAINIGEAGTRACYEVKMDNIEIKNFISGMEVNHALSETYEETTYESKISNINVGEIYGMGLSFGTSIIELNNARFGYTGAGSIENLHQLSNMAGLTDDKRQTITISGNFIPSPPIVDSQYFQDYSLSQDLSTINFTSIIDWVMRDVWGKNGNRVEHAWHDENDQSKYQFPIFALIDPTFWEEIEKRQNDSVTAGSPIIPEALWNSNKAEVWEILLDKILPTEENGLIPGTEKKHQNAGYNATDIVFETGDTCTDMRDISDNKGDYNTKDRFLYLDAKIKVPLDIPISGYDSEVLIGRIYFGNSKYIPTAA